MSSIFTKQPTTSQKGFLASKWNLLGILEFFWELFWIFWELWEFFGNFLGIDKSHYFIEYNHNLLFFLPFNLVEPSLWPCICWMIGIQAMLMATKTTMQIRPTNRSSLVLASLRKHLKHKDVLINFSYSVVSIKQAGCIFFVKNS